MKYAYTGVFDRYIHQYIPVYGLFGCIEYEIEVDSRRMLHDGNRFWPDRPGDKLKPEFGVKRLAGQEVSHSQADVIDSFNFFQRVIPDNVIIFVGTDRIPCGCARFSEKGWLTVYVGIEKTDYTRDFPQLTVFFILTDLY